MRPHALHLIKRITRLGYAPEQVGVYQGFGDAPEQLRCTNKLSLSADIPAPYSSR